jgi:glycine dehydrogenase
MSTHFSQRHIGPSDTDCQTMLKVVNASTLQDLILKAAPSNILAKNGFDIGAGLSEKECLDKAKSLAKKNKVYRSVIGQGYYGTHTPGVILRNILENPGWYTAYTPYQAEISQGRMEALLNFQTMICDLTGMTLSNASLLDEGTAASEAVALAFHSQKKNPKNKLYVNKNIFPQTLAVLQTRAKPLDIEIQILDLEKPVELKDSFACVVQYPNSLGEVINWSDLAKQCKANQSTVICIADILSLCVLTPPGEWGADIVVGSTQRFGVPMGFGGPHAAYLATRDELARSMPGRIIGLSKDVHGNPALRLALQTREQHIRREKATSNICTAQVLLAVMASMYAVYHGPEGLKKIAARTRKMTHALYQALKPLGFNIVTKNFFDTICIELNTPSEVQTLKKLFLTKEINLATLSDTRVGISLDELTDENEVQIMVGLFAQFKNKTVPQVIFSEPTAPALARNSEFLTHPTFNSYRSETDMLRYIHRLEQKDLALNKSMIPLGSCTMKLNATTEMIPVTWPEFSNIHPFAPNDQTQGYLELIKQLEYWLEQVTGFAAISLQPNAGSQGEYAGLLVIRAYHESRGDKHRDVCLIPTSAHGTNPASAVMAGMKVVPVQCDKDGNIDMVDLKGKAEMHSSQLAALMVTYPSTHGVFESSIVEVCEIIHKFGGQVYMDGANFNALVGIARPGEFGVDVSHLNLHKTFCIPHGGGGPGIGPIGVAKHLVDFLPGHVFTKNSVAIKPTGAVTSAPWGSAGILSIPWAYIAMMGADGLRKATQVAILNANYMAKKLSPHYPIVYKGKNGLVAHECIIDVREFKTTADISVEDIAKRLMDYGFHAPTMSWPVIGTLMIEPTESESLSELDRFCDAMISIREEIREIENGKFTKEDNVLKNAPHTASVVISDTWKHTYGREKAAFPLPYVKNSKYWPTVGRVDNVYGDRNLVCSCPPMTDYQ